MYKCIKFINCKCISVVYIPIEWVHSEWTPCESIIFNAFQEQREVIDCLVNGIKNTKYSENVRKFSMNQQYYSMAAYKSLRLFFNKNLPARRTLQMWYTAVDGSPGISGSAIDIIREKAESYLAENKRQLYLTLMWDEMSIRKALVIVMKTKRSLVLVQ